MLEKNRRLFLHREKRVIGIQVFCSLKNEMESNRIIQ